MLLILVSIGKGCPYLYSGSKFRVIWPVVLIIHGGVGTTPFGKCVWEKRSGEQGLTIPALNFNQLHSTSTACTRCELTVRWSCQLFEKADVVSLHNSTSYINAFPGLLKVKMQLDVNSDLWELSLTRTILFVYVPGSVG